MVNAQPDIERLRSLVGTSLGKILAVRPVESGTTGTSYRIDTTSKHYIAKLFPADSDVLLGPKAQFALLDRLAPTAIAPLPAMCDEAAGLLVTEYIRDARAVSLDEIRQPARIRQLVRLLKILHRTDAAIHRFEPKVYAHRYFERLGGRERLSPRDGQRSQELLELADDLDDRTCCLCHNDLTADNVLFGASPRLIDFDYAVVASPILDLASVAVMNSFSPEQEMLLLNAYADDSELPFSGTDFVRVQRLVRLLSHFWSLASGNAGAAIVSKYRMQDV
jgi:thiamine kinase-like enzyme